MRVSHDTKLVSGTPTSAKQKKTRSRASSATAAIDVRQASNIGGSRSEPFNKVLLRNLVGLPLHFWSRRKLPGRSRAGSHGGIESVPADRRDRGYVGRAGGRAARGNDGVSPAIDAPRQSERHCFKASARWCQPWPRDDGNVGSPRAEARQAYAGRPCGARRGSGWRSSGHWQCVLRGRSHASAGRLGRGAGPAEQWSCPPAWHLPSRRLKGGGRAMKRSRKDNPVQWLPDWRITLPLAQSAPRCGARTRSGVACRSPAMPNGRCRLHGGKSTGPKTAEGLERMRQSKITHGNYSEENRRVMRLIRELAAEARRTAGEL